METISGIQSYSFTSLKSIAGWYSWPIEEKYKHIRAGLTKTQMLQFKEFTCLDYMTLSKICFVSLRTFYYKIQQDVLDGCITNGLTSLINLYGLGYTQVCNADAFNRWMKTACPSMNYRRPIDVCGTDIGRTAIKEEILKLPLSVML